MRHKKLVFHPLHKVVSLAAAGIVSSVLALAACTPTPKTMGGNEQFSAMGSMAHQKEVVLIDAAHITRDRFGETRKSKPD